MNLKQLLSSLFSTILLSTIFVSTANAQCISGETVFLRGGETEISTCPGDGVPDELELRTSSQATPFAFLITDENNVILDVSINNYLDFEDAGVGVCRIWAFSFAGQILAQPGEVATDAVLASICYELTDNYVTVNRTVPDGGMVTAEGGATQVFTCPGDGVADVVTFETTSAAVPYAYIITDENNIILDFANGNSQDFEGAPAGVCRVWGLAYAGNIIAEVGDDITAVTLADNCHELSETYLEVIRGEADGGTVALDDGSTEATVCIGDGEADELTFTHTTNTIGASYTYVITDDQNNILGIPSGNSQDFEGAEAGVCRVWGLAYTGDIIAEVGDNAAMTDLADGCFDLSDNFITVNRIETEGATVALEDGSTEIDVCVGDGIADELTFTNTSTAGQSYAYVITDENNNILGLPGGNSQDFEGAGVGICRVWGLSYSGNITAAVGDNAAAVALTDECFDLSDNFITVNRQLVDGGTVATTDGETAVTVCAGDDVEDILTFVATTDSPLDYAYVVTDDQNTILAILDGDMVDFEVAGPGVCRVWGLSYAGNVIAEPGDDAANTALTDGCFDLSDNFVEVTRVGVEGAMVELTLGVTEIDVCVNDGNPDVLSFTNNSTIGADYAYIITDENNVVLTVANGDSQDFEGAGEGVCRVWGLSYTGNLTVIEGESAVGQDLSDECFDLSDNFITVNRESVDGGEVAISGGDLSALVCVGDGNPDIFTFEFNSSSNADYVFVVTDDNNVILSILMGDMIDFDVAGTGTCRVWGLSYRGNIIAEPGDNASSVLADQCFDLSDNFVEINRVETEGGTVSTPAGDTTVYTCPGDGIADVIDFVSTSTSSADYAYVVTDEDNNILALADGDSFDFDGAPEGTCRVWGLSYVGNIIAEVGDNAAMVALTDDCYELSENFITVVREMPDGGTVSTTEGATRVYTCPGDGNADIVSFMSADASSGSYAYVVTDENNVILSIPTDNSQDFDGAPEGICRVWGLAYTGNVTAEVGDTASMIALSDDCFDLSDNFIEVVRSVAEGGTVSTVSGDSAVYVCIGDDVPDLVEFASQGASNANFTYVITTDDNTILAIPDGNEVDFDVAGEGICRVWGLSYTGNIIAQEGDNAAMVDLSDDCFDLSDNFIVINRDVPEGGTITDINGNNQLQLCVGDGNPDVVQFLATGFSNSLYTYLITDENDFFISSLTNDNFDFENAVPGNCRVYGLAHTGDLLLFPGDNIFQVPELTNGCYDLTDNYIELNRIGVNGGQITTIAGDTLVYTCPGDGVADLIEFFTTGVVLGAEYQYVITDENDEILGFIPEDSFDFETAGNGICHVWGVSYTGTFAALPGQIVTAIELSDQCYELSQNFITVVRDQPEGGIVTADGASDIRVCIGTGDESVSFETTSASNAAYVYLVTDEDNTILAISESNVIDFSGADEGVCRVWGLSYTGDLLAQPGDDAAAVELATNCFELSSEFVRVERSVELDGGEISNLIGEITVYTCPNDGISDLVAVATTSMSTANYDFIVTDENNNILAPDIDGNVIDFDAALPGTCRIWGVSYTGNLTAQFGENAAESALSDDCYVLSDNFITVIRAVPDGGTVATDSNETSVTVIVGDGEPDVINFTNAGASNSPYQYVITDEDNVIIGLANGDSQDFEGADTGVCRVWGLAYTGNITAMVGDTASAVALTDDCFDLSDNFIEVNRVSAFDGENPENLVPSTPEAARVSITSVQLAPNPASDLLNISFDVEVVKNSRSQLSILSNTGTLIQQEQVPTVEGNNIYEVNIANLPQGIYYLQLRNGDDYQYKKFIKQ